ncbi:MAG: calycin-like domain-containing protein [Bacteroidales bacterium]|nr:calycin-like domain-containing protein [Bacteroidales bacterium]
MKKLCTLFLSLVLCVASALATDYTGDLYINAGVVGEQTQQGRVVSLELTNEANCLYKMSINNFKFGVLPSLGDIVLENVQGQKQTDGSVKISATDYSLTLKIGTVKVSLEATVSADGNTFTTQKLDIADAPAVGTVKCSFSGTAPNTSALSQIVAGDSNSFKVYNLAGREVLSADAPGVYIVRYANGKTKKFIKK